MDTDRIHLDIDGFKEAVLASAPGSVTIVVNQGRPEDAYHLASWLSAVVGRAGTGSRHLDLSADGALRAHHGGMVQDMTPMDEGFVVLSGMDDAWTASASGAILARQLDQARSGDAGKRIVIVRTDEDLSHLLADAAVLPETTIAMERRLTAPLVHLMREVSGYDMMRCKAAALEAIERYDADFVLAVGILNANSYAVRVRSLDPAVSEAEARRRWNVANAMGRRGDYVKRSDAGRRLDELSGRYRGD